MFARFPRLAPLTLAAALVTLSGCCEFEISTKTVPSGTVAQPYSFNLDTKCGDASWHLNSGVLPPGLGLDLKGKIAGTPTLAGTYTFTIDAVSKTDPENDIISQGYSLVVVAGAAPAASLPALSHGVTARYDGRR